MKKLLNLVIIILFTQAANLFCPAKQTIGVLPYTQVKDAQGSTKVFMLFGKTSNGILSDNDWSDFNSTILPTDKTDEEAAARILSAQTRLIYGDILQDLKSHKFNVNDLNNEIKSTNATDVLDYYSKLKKSNKIAENAMKKIIDDATKKSMNYFLSLLKDAPKLKRDFTRGGSHTIYFIKVSQPNLEYFCGGLKVPGWQQTGFAWVDNDQLMAQADSLLRTQDVDKAAEKLTLPSKTIGCGKNPVKNGKIDVSLAKMLLGNDGQDILENLFVPDAPIKPKKSENLDLDLSKLSQDLSQLKL